MSYHPLHDPDDIPLQLVSQPQSHNDNPTGMNSSLEDYSPSSRVMSNRWRWRLVRSYGPDWVITIALAATFFLLDYVPGFKRDFSLEDTSLRHTYAVHERVPPLALYMICGVAPFVLQARDQLAHYSLLSYTLAVLLGLSITGAITQFSKITVGRPRPDVIARCIPIAGAADPPLGLSTAAICTQTDSAIMRDGWRSFPSGHASLSFAGLGFLSFYLAGKLHLFDQRGHTPKAWLAVAPLSGAALVAISRTMDYRHHWHDVLAGSLLGLVVSYFSYRQFYPSLASELSHYPYPHVFKRGGDILPTHRCPPLSSAPLTQIEQQGYQQDYRDHNRDSLANDDLIQDTLSTEAPRQAKDGVTA
ncbi:putative diacylglycerol pyrophosphate phosphatase 1 [Grifola frondosa]|uniref:Putative diacylglycerol pyrophosphate phosphatase 1 n=1 Tax=Grifola frondosa TaxID=5627 RepID=A0A1C7MHN8_GRIFR|nr:putative diacylglycerol pyrophosphate phosphatase 1 [Grifola frondosa]